MGENDAEDAPSPPAAKAGAKHWVRASIDKVPTKWISAAGVGLFLAATAAFGGLGTVSQAGPPELGLGEHVVTATLDMSVDKVAVIDSLHQSGSSPAEGTDERVLAVLVDATSLDSEYRYAATQSGFADARIEGGPDVAPSIERYDDRSGDAPVLQPDLPVLLLLTWVVEGDDFRDGDEVRITLPDPQKSIGQLFYSGALWTAGGPAAFVTTPIVDLGDTGEDGLL